MSDVAQSIGLQLDEIERTSKYVLQVLNETGNISPVRYQAAVEAAVRLRVRWASYRRTSMATFDHLSKMEPSFRDCLIAFGRDDEELERQLRFLTPARWPRSTDLGLTSLRLRASHIIPLLLEQIEVERLTVTPLLRRWSTRTNVARVIVHRNAEQFLKLSASA